MSELSIRVTIAGRIYPLTVDRSEEESVRKAAKHIEEKINALKNEYAVNDIQDYLAMVALEFSTQLQQPVAKPAPDGLEDKVDEINELLHSYLK
jgi:cell division protein ZapA